jgi:hypothetical protein
VAPQATISPKASPKRRTFFTEPLLLWAIAVVKVEAKETKGRRPEEIARRLMVTAEKAATGLSASEFSKISSLFTQATVYHAIVVPLVDSGMRSRLPVHWPTALGPAGRIPAW